MNWWQSFPNWNQSMNDLPVNFDRQQDANYVDLESGHPGKVRPSIFDDKFIDECHDEIEDAGDLHAVRNRAPMHDADFGL